MLERRASDFFWAPGRADACALSGPAWAPVCGPPPQLRGRLEGGWDRVGGRARVDKKGRRHRLAGGGPGSSDVASVNAPPQVGVLLRGRLRRPFLFTAFVTTLHVADFSTFANNEPSVTCAPFPPDPLTSFLFFPFFSHGCVIMDAPRKELPSSLSCLRCPLVPAARMLCAAAAAL